jgi:hypothetical protein
LIVVERAVDQGHQRWVGKEVSPVRAREIRDSDSRLWFIRGKPPCF